MQFQFMLQLESGPSVSVNSIEASIPLKFRHFSPTPITVGAGSGANNLNLGFRLRSLSRPQWLHEGRCTFTANRTLAPDAWVHCVITVPRSVIDLTDTYSLFVDMVVEGYYWFSDKRNSGETFKIHFTDVKDRRNDDLALSQVKSLRDLLTKAHMRIAELEHAERIFGAERDDLQAKIRSANERTSRAIVSEGLLPPMSAKIEALMSSVDMIERRDIWLTELTRLGVEGPVYALYPHNHEPGRQTILLTGSGGFGDMIYLTPVIRELYLAFGAPNILVLHENPNSNVVFDRNPYVAGVVKLDPGLIRNFMHVVNCIDVFDLVVDVRYAVTYSTPPLSRMPEDFIRRALYSSAEWQRYVRYAWPQMNNIFSKKVMALNMSKLDLVGRTSLLPIDKSTIIDMFIEQDGMCRISELRSTPYITIHHGADRKMTLGKNVQTKNLSIDQWTAVVKDLRQSNYTVVQMGESGESLVPGVDIDLRGATNFSQSAHVIKLASCHVDTEGGLVHVCRAVQNRAVVMFGPTPVEFFGYNTNVNLGTAVCSNCWWTTADWSARCPRGLETPECMDSHDPKAVAAAAIQLAANSIAVEITGVKAASLLRSVDDLRRQLTEISAGGGRGFLAMFGDINITTLVTLAREGISDFDLLVPAHSYGKISSQLLDDLVIKPISYGNVPIGNSTYSWGLISELDIRNADGLSLCVDLARCVIDNGRLSISSMVTEDALMLSEWVQHIANAAGGIVGTRYSVSVAPEIIGSAANSLRSSNVLIEAKCRHVASTPISRNSYAS